MGNILLVDDDPTVRGVVSDYLRAAGHSITEASDGISALELADGCDLVILDLMLPGIDGLEVFRRIRFPWGGCTGDHAHRQRIGGRSGAGP